MIQEVAGWAYAMWHVLRAKAYAAGLIGRPGAPDSLLGLDFDRVLDLAEAELYAGGNAEHLHDLYVGAAKASRRTVGTGSRSRDIAAFLEAVN